MTKNDIRTSGRVLTLLMIFAAVFMLTVSVGAFRGESHEDGHASRYGLVITNAEWKQDRSLLQLEGKNAVGKGFVRISDASHDRLIGSATADKNGMWKLMTVMSVPVPCRVQAESGFMAAERDVTGDRNQLPHCPTP